jgi:hypothetical protein
VRAAQAGKLQISNKSEMVSPQLPGTSDAAGNLASGHSAKVPPAVET